MGWFLPKSVRSRQRANGMESRTSQTRILPVVEKLEDRTAPAVALFGAGVLSLNADTGDQFTLLDGATAGTQLRVLMSTGLLNYSGLPSGLVAAGSTPTDATFNLDVLGNDVNQLKVDFGSSSQSVATFSGLNPVSLLDVGITDSTVGSGSNLMMLGGKVDLSAGNGSFNAVASRLTMRVYGALNTGAGSINLSSSFPGGNLTVSSSASPQLKGKNIFLDINGAIGDNSNPLILESTGTLQAFTSDANANLQASGSVKMAQLDLGLGIATLGGVFSTTGADKISNLTTIDLASGSTLTLGGSDTIAGLSGAGTLANAGKNLRLDTSSTTTFAGAMAGAGTLTISGAGKQILSGVSSYSGGTSVLSGSLVLANSTAAGNGGIVVSSGASLGLQGGISVANAVTVGGSGVAGGGAIQNISGANELFGAISQSAGTIYSTANGSSLNVSGSIGRSGGPWGLTHLGTGTLRLGGANTYGSTTNVQGGTVILANATAASTGGVLVENGAGLVLEGGISVSNQVYLEGFGPLGTGALVGVGGNNTVTGNIILNGDSAASSGAGTTLTLGGVVSDGGNSRGMSYLGGTVILTAANTYTGTSQTQGGALQLGNGGLTGSVASTSFVNDGLLTFMRTDAVGTPFVFSPTVSGSGPVDVLSGAVRMDNDNTVSGTVTIASGATLQLGNGGTTGSIGSTDIVDDGSLIYDRSGSVSLEVAISGNGSVTYRGLATYNLSSDNSYSGGTSISGSATVVVSGSTALGSGLATVDSGGALALDGTAGSLTLTNPLALAGSGPSGFGALQNRGGLNSASGVITLNAGTLITTVDGSSLGLDGVISDGGKLFGITHLGYAGGQAGALSFSAANTFGGTLNNTSGLVALSNSKGAGTGPIAVQDGATLALNGANGNLSVANLISAKGVGVNGIGAILNQFGNNTLSGVITLAGNTSIAPYQQLISTGVIGGAYSLSLIGGGTFVTTATNSYKGATIIDSGTTMQLGNGGATGLIASNDVTNNGSIVFNRNDVVAFNFVPLISGTGSVTVATGSVRFSSDNSYTGDTSILAGATLVLGNKGAAGSVGSTNIIIGGTLEFNRNDLPASPFVEAANLLGAGSLKVTTGVVVLTADSSFAGGVSIASGALLGLGNGGSTGSLLATSISNDGTLDFNRLGNQAIDTTISGKGLVEFLGGGDYTLNKANGYSGGTSIGALSGTRVNLANGTAAGTGTITILSGSTLAAQGGITISNAIKMAGSGIGGIGALLNASANNTLTGAVTLTDGSSVGAASGTILTLAGVVSQNVNVYGLTVGGSGTVVSTNANTYTGTTNIVAGATLRLGNGGVTGSVASGAIVANGTLAFNRSDATTQTALISGGGSLELQSGSVTLVGNNTFAGAVTIASGTLLTVGNGKAAGALPATSISNAGQLVFSRNNALDVVASISGSGQVSYLSGANYSVSGNSSYNGTTLIDGNSGVSLSSGTGFGTGVVTVKSGSAINFDATFGNLTVGNPISIVGNGPTGDGALQNYSGNNKLTGKITLTGNTGIVRETGSSLELSGGVTESGGSYGLVLNGPGTLILSAAGTFSGGLDVQNGILLLTNSTGAGSGVVDIRTGAELALNGGLTVANNLTVAGSGPGSGGALLNVAGNNILSGTIDLGSNIEVVTSSGELTLSGVIADGGNIYGLTTGGAGTLVLGGNNLFSGAINATEGNLRLVNSNAGGFGLISVFSTATLQLSGGITVANAIRLSGQGVGSDDGALQVLDGDNLITGAITLTADSTISLVGTSQLTVSGVIDDGLLDNSLTVTGPDGAYLILTADNTYNGTTTIVGTGVILGDGTTMSGSIASKAVILIQNGGLAVDRTDTALSPFVIDALISGDGEFGTFGGATSLTNTNTYTGLTWIDLGTELFVTSTGSLQSGQLYVLGTLEYQQSNSVSLNGEYYADGLVRFTNGGNYSLNTDSSFNGTVFVDTATTLNVPVYFPATMELVGTLAGAGQVGSITGVSGSAVVTGNAGIGNLQATDLDFSSTGGNISYTVSDTGNSLVGTGLVLDGGLEANLNNAQLVINPVGTLTSQGTVLYLIDFTQGGSVGASRFTDSNGSVLAEDAQVTFGGKSGTLHYNFGPQGNDVVLLMVENYSAYTYDAAAGTLLVALGQNTNLTAEDFGSATSLIISQASSTPIAWVQYGGDSVSGATATNLLVDPALTGLVTINQRTGLVAGTNQVALNGLTLLGGLDVDLSGANATAISIGGTGLQVGGDLSLTSGYGDINQTASMTVGGASVFTAGANISLTTSENSFAGLVTASVSNSVAITGAGDLSTASVQGDQVVLIALGNVTLGVVTTRELSLTAGGEINQSGPAISTGNLVINALGKVTLNDGSNDFSTVSLLNAGDTELVDASGMTLAEADNLSGSLSVTTQGNLGLSLPSGQLVAVGDINLTTALGKEVVANGTSGLEIISSSGAITIDSSKLSAIGQGMKIEAATTVNLPMVNLLNSVGGAEILVQAGTVVLNGSVMVQGKGLASVNMAATDITLGKSLTITANDSAGTQEAISLVGTIGSSLAGTNLVLEAGESIVVEGALGTLTSPLGDLTFAGGDLLVMGDVFLGGDLKTVGTTGSMSFNGDIKAVNLDIRDAGDLIINGDVTLSNNLNLTDTSTGFANTFEGAIQAANLLIHASGSILLFGGAVSLTGKADFQAIGADGVEFRGALTADQLLVKASSGNYPVSLFSDATINQKMSFQNGGVLTLGDAGNEVFWFKGGFDQATGVSAVDAVGTIRGSAAMTISGLNVNGLPLTIDSNGNPISILGQANVTSGLNLKGSTSTFSGASNLTTGVITTQTGGLSLGAGEVGFKVDGAIAGTGYTQFRSVGPVSISNAELKLNLGSYVAGVGTILKLVDNSGSVPVVGTFNGLPEGASYTLGDQTFIISYVGGTGNDITARAVRTIPTPIGPVVAQPFNLEPGSLVAGIGRGQVRISWYEEGQEKLQVITPFPFYTGSVNLTTVDRSGDGIADAVVAMVAGGAEPAVVVIDSGTGQVAQSFYAFAPQFLGGGTVAGGVVNLGGTVTTVIAVGAGAGAEPSVTVFDAVSGQFIEAFYAYSQQYVGGVTVGITAPDVNQNSLIIAASAINSHVTLFDLNYATQAVASFYAFAPSAGWQPISVAGGVFTGADNKPFQAIVVGAAPGWPCSVAVFDIRGVAQKAFYAFNPAFQGGVRVGVSDLNRDGLLEILAGSGPGTQGTLNVFDYNTLDLVDALFISDTTQGVTLGSNLTV